VRPSLRVPFLQRLRRITGESKDDQRAAARRSGWQWGLLLIAWIALVTALARPRWMEDPVVREQPMRDLLVALDLSGSMETEDFVNSAGQVTNRLSAAKEVLANFISGRQGDRVGLIFFGTFAYVQAPFSDDIDVVLELLDEAQVRMLGPRTAFGDAIGQAIPLFERSAVEEKVLVVLTDGNDTSSQVPPQRAAEIAADQGVVIYPVAMGDPESAGEQALDEATLDAVARATGGRWFHAADRQEMDAVYETLDALNPRQVESLSYRPEHDLFQWPLGLAVLLVLAWHAWRALRLQRAEA
jgi:Ca-activated chloride channel family protein